MTFLAPFWLWLAGAAGAVVVALHFFARQRPRPALLPTARFVPDLSARAPSIASRPSDVLVMILRVIALLAAGLALAGPRGRLDRRPVARVVAVVASGAERSPAEARDSAASYVAEGDTLVSAPTVSSALIAAIRASSAQRDRADSIELVLVSAFTVADFDAATDSVRRLWPGRARLVRLAPADSQPPRRIELEGAADDPLRATLALLGPRRGEVTRIARGALPAADSSFAREGGVLLEWPRDPAARWPARQTDTVGAVGAGDVVVVAPFTRAAALEQGRAVAFWVDGAPAATEQPLGSGCLRRVAIPLPAAGDLVLRRSVRDLVDLLAGPCGGRAGSAARVGRAAGTPARHWKPAALAPGAGTAARRVERFRLAAGPYGAAAGAGIVRARAPGAVVSAVPLTLAASPGTVARVDRARRVLTMTTVARALIAAAAVLVAGVALLAALDTVLGLSRPVRSLALPASTGAAVMTALLLIRRGRHARSRQRVVLWIEERTPSLRYALATLMDPGLPPAQTSGDLEQVVAAAEWGGALSRSTLRALLPHAALLAAGAVVLMILPPAAVGRVARPRPGDVLDAVTGRSARSPLSPIVATVTPPAYTGRRAATIEEPASVAGISGSEVRVEGRGPGSRVRAALGDSAVATRTEGERWVVAFRMPAAAVALRLAAAEDERLVAIEPYPDSAPSLMLRVPARDTVFRAPSGTLALGADLRDDVGLTEGWFEYIVTSGEMESFRFRTGVLQRTSFAGERGATLTGTLDLSEARLVPGDVVHLRAVATDGNTVSGPGRGASETRTLRVARLGEFDSLAIEGLPPMMGDSAALSQRMLIMLAEALQRRRPSLTRDTVVRESQDIARDQARLRRRVADVIFLRVSGEASMEESEGDEGRPTTPEEVLAAAEEAANRASDTTSLDFSEDESPVVSINRPLLEAYNAMWQAGRELEVGEPDDALPHMRIALAAIQRARAAERIYLRGRPPTRVVDLRSARLKGDMTGASGARRVPGRALGAERARLLERLGEAFAVAAEAPGDAADSLLLLRLEALGRHQDFALAAGRAAAALRAGRDARPDLLRARDALLGTTRHLATLPAWDAAP